MNNVNELHEALARVVVADRELSEILTEITGIARRAMPRVEAASVTLIRADRPFTAAYDGQMALDADELQYERGYGPCVDAGLAGQMFLVDDMRTEQRWPDYAQNVAAHGVLSSLSVPLPFQGVTIGALNTYAGQPKAFDDSDVELAKEIAAWVAVAIGNAETASRTSDDLALLRTVMTSRACIEQAKGILMERNKIIEDEAFTILTHTPNEPIPNCATSPLSSSGPARCPVEIDARPRETPINLFESNLRLAFDGPKVIGVTVSYGVAWRYPTPSRRFGGFRNKCPPSRCPPLERPEVVDLRESRHLSGLSRQGRLDRRCLLR